MTTESAFQTARAQLRTAVDQLGLSENDWQTLSTPRRILEVAVPLRRDNDKVEMYKGYRVQYSTTRGPSKGGVRFHPQIDLEETIALAMLMTWKCALTNLPFFSLDRGFLSGKYRPGVTVDSVRADGVKEYQTDMGWAVVAALDEIAKAHNSSVSAIALAWLRANPQVSTPIASARTVGQLNEIIEVVELSSGDIKNLNSPAVPN